MSSVLRMVAEGTSRARYKPGVYINDQQEFLKNSVRDLDEDGSPDGSSKPRGFHAEVVGNAFREALICLSKARLTK